MNESERFAKLQEITEGYANMRRSLTDYRGSISTTAMMTHIIVIGLLAGLYTATWLFALPYFVSVVNVLLTVLLCWCLSQCYDDYRVKRVKIDEALCLVDTAEENFLTSGESPVEILNVIDGILDDI